VKPYLTFFTKHQSRDTKFVSFTMAPPSTQKQWTVQGTGSFDNLKVSLIRLWTDLTGRS